MPDFKKLTTAEVASKRFTPVRMREGYSTDEVDEFLEAVEETIDAYDGELRQITGAYNELKASPPQPPQNGGLLTEAQAEVARLRRALTEAEQSRDSFGSQLQLMGTQLIEARKAAEDAIAKAAAGETFDVAELDIASATGIIARILENAAKNHDDLIAQGESEAMRIRDDALVEAEQILAEATETAKGAVVEDLEAYEGKLRESIAGLELLASATRDALLSASEEALERLRSHGSPSVDS